ncbi:MAG: hypothetical protein Q8876_07855 [Bacillota bacterium]|nr:hypothetical protein [Bacillota bacterium]
MDIFIEQIVKKEKTLRDTITKVIIILCAFLIPMIFVLVGFIITPYFIFLGLCALIVTIYVAYLLISGLKLEYEYSISDGYLIIDKIIAKRKRKRFLKVDIKIFEEFFPVNSRDDNYGKIRKSYFAGMTDFGDDVYAARFRKEPYGNCMLFFSPNEKFLKVMRPYLKREIVTELLKAEREHQVTDNETTN